MTGRDQVAAAMGIYGPRTTYVLALKDSPGTHEFLLLDEGVVLHNITLAANDCVILLIVNMINLYNILLLSGKWQHVKDTTEIGEGKMFSPGNLRATFDNPDYDKVNFIQCSYLFSSMYLLIFSELCF